MLSNADQHTAGKYRYCPERAGEVVSLRGSCAGMGGLRFSVRGAKIRIGYFFRVFGLIGKSVRRSAAGAMRYFYVPSMGYRSLDIRQAACCARL